ncbi:MAG: phosphoribosylaminoimidazolesuccinocarboxamide synthase [Xanthomonadales bacterium]|nr:phosphoribosylaminoimidazolesuccinocarboxamide synthase [Xanthomonadales bacterium]
MKAASEVLFESDIHQLERIARGKVRDIYEVGLHDLLIVTCDRLSAFDVVLPNPIPGKGIVLNRISNFWFDRTEHIIPNHRVELSVASAVGDHPELPLLEPRSMVVKRLKPLPFEAIVRGYLAGSGWKDYQATGSVCGIKLPSGLEQSAQLPRPIFTPSTKADSGHDQNVSLERLEATIGKALADKVAAVSLKLYEFAAAYARERGIIIADTKFEFGLDETGSLILIDELLTPDSSRFWPADKYQTGISPPSYDKQFVRDWLEAQDWDKSPPAPELPDEIVEKTRDRYLMALEQLTGERI